MSEAAGALADHADPRAAAPRHAQACAWAELMRRAFGFDVLARPRCGERAPPLPVELPDGSGWSDEYWLS